MNGIQFAEVFLAVGALGYGGHEARALGGALHVFHVEKGCIPVFVHRETSFAGIACPQKRLTIRRPFLWAYADGGVCMGKMDNLLAQGLQV